MRLNWQQSTIQTDQGLEQVLHKSECSTASDNDIKAALGQCVEKAAQLLPINIQDDSLFLLFEWDRVQSLLNIVVTNGDKSLDSPHIVRCNFTATESSAAQRQAPDAYAEHVYYWIKDYLTTCAAFMNFSLVAAFYLDSREQSMLL